MLYRSQVVSWGSVLKHTQQTMRKDKPRPESCMHDHKCVLWQLQDSAFVNLLKAAGYVWLYKEGIHPLGWSLGSGNANGRFAIGSHGALLVHYHIPLLMTVGQRLSWCKSFPAFTRLHWLIPVANLVCWTLSSLAKMHVCTSKTEGYNPYSLLKEGSQKPINDVVY